MTAKRSLGYRLGDDTGPEASPAAFGHVGGGGSFGYADPARHFAIAFTKNFLEDPPGRVAGEAVARAVVSVLGI